jgi:tetratricopeptide (TPR) repeat protein
LIRVRTALSFDGALAMLRRNRDPDLQKFIFQEASKELTTNDKVSLGALSFFVPSSTFEAWMKVANLSRNALETTIDRLSALSLVDVLAGEERYALHPLTRAFVRDELLTDANVTRETVMRFVKYWVNYTQQYGGDSKNSYKTYGRLETEWTNLDAAVNWLWEIVAVKGDDIGDKDAAQILNDLAKALVKFLRYSGRWDEGMQFSAWAYEAMRLTQEWSDSGWYAYIIAGICHDRARTDDAASWADRSAEAQSRGGSRSIQAMVTRMRGMIARQRKDYTEAQRLLQNALAIFRDLGEESNIAVVLNSLGGLERERKNYDTAERYYREALEIDTKRDDKVHQATLFNNFGRLACDRKQWAEARMWCEQAITLAKEFRKQELIARAQYGLACVEEAERRADLALPLAQESLKIHERLQHRELAVVRELVKRLEKQVGSKQK